MLDHTEILGIENEGASLIFINRQIFAGSGLLHYRVFPAAGMRTRALIGVPACKIITQKAAAGIGNTHGAMNKGLNLHIFRNLPADLPQFLQRQLPGRHHPFCALLIPEPPGQIIGIIGLRADMPLDLRADFFCQHKHARVRNDQRVRLQLPQLLKIGTDSLQIPVMSQNIRRHMNAYAMLVSELDSFFHILRGKIFRLGSETEGFSADVDSIRAESHGSLQDLQAAGRYQKLRFFPLLFHLLSALLYT